MEEDKLKLYAPVAIATLNRYDHFTRCLESLERCSLAEYTDVYVGLDYPPSEKYIEGWKKIDAYLLEKEKTHKFKNLFVRRRDHNCGVANPNSNSSLLLSEIQQKYDRFILTEDDNEFSPNFLEYINWGLDYYKDDPSIFAICGFKNLDTDDIRNNVYKLNTIFSAWGYGTWFLKKEKYDILKDHDVLRRMVQQASIKDIFSSKVLTSSSLLYQIAKKTFHGDVLISLLPEDEKWCVFPRENKVRNWGWDGTGLHGGSQEAFEKYSSMEIDSSPHFIPEITEDLFNPKVLERFKEKYKHTFKEYLRAVIVVSLYKLMGRIPVPAKNKWYRMQFLKV